MNKIFALALAGFVATAAQAGDKSVSIPVYDNGPVILYTNTNWETYGGPIPSIAEVTTTTATATATSRSMVGQNGNGQIEQDVLYARLLKEAQRRGLR